MKCRNFRRAGLTLVEIMVVLTIVAILGAMSVAIYRAYRSDARDKEAIAGLFQLAAQARSTVFDWGVEGVLGAGVTQKCLEPNPSTPQYDPRSPTLWDTGGSDGAMAWKNLGLNLEGSHWWNYRVCFFVDDNNADNFLVSANLMIKDAERVGYISSGMEIPVIDLCVGISIPSHFPSQWTPCIPVH